MFVAVAFLLASPAAPRFYSYEHADNSHGRWNDTASFLGLVYNADDCQQVCIDRFGGDATKGCTAWTFYHAGHYKSEVRRHCYGDHATGTWAPFYSSLDAPSEWGNVTSGQNEPASFVTPCSSRDDCSYNGHCSDAGVCECYPQWMGKHCGQLHLIPTPKSSGLESTDGGEHCCSYCCSPGSLRVCVLRLRASSLRDCIADDASSSSLGGRRARKLMGWLAGARRHGRRLDVSHVRRRDDPQHRDRRVDV